MGVDDKVRALLNATIVMQDGEKLKVPELIVEHLDGKDIEDLIRPALFGHAQRLTAPGPWACRQVA